MPVLAFLISPVGRWLGGAAAVLALLGGAWAYVHHKDATEASLRAQLAQSKAQAVRETGQANAASDAAKIIDQGRAKADVTVHIQQENSRAILSAPGASDAVDPGLMSALVSGLCRYDAYASDPQCLALRAADPAKLPPAHPASSDTGANDWGFSSGARPSYGPT